MTEMLLIVGLWLLCGLLACVLLWQFIHRHLPNNTPPLEFLAVGQILLGPIGLWNVLLESCKFYIHATDHPPLWARVVYSTGRRVKRAFVLSKIQR